MVDSERETGRADHEQLERTETVQLLYVDGEEDSRDAVATTVRDHDTLELVKADNGTSIRSVTRRASVDCLVATPEMLLAHEALLDLDSVPTVLYTDDDPTAVPDRAIEECDSLVRKSREGSATLLVEKVLGIVHSRTAADDTAIAVSQMLQTDLSDIGVFVVDEAGHIEWASAPFEEVFPVEDPAARSGAGDFYARLATLLPESQPTDSVLNLRGSAKHRSGSHLSVPVGDERRQYLHFSRPSDGHFGGHRVETFVDVTGLADRYERLALFENLVENAEDGLFVLDADGHIEYCNRSYAEMLGYTQGELVGEHASKVMSSSAMEKSHELLSEVLEGRDRSAVFDLQLTTAADDILETSIHFSVQQVEDEYAGIMGVVRDITERKQREHQLEQYRTLVESAADPMYALDEDGVIQICNRAMAEFVGTGRETLVGQDVAELLPVESLEAGRDALQRTLSEDDTRTESFEAWLTDADGEERLFEVTVNAVTEDGSFQGSVATFRDVTKRHNRASELDLRKQVFARSLRHNIRNETSIIHSYGSLLADELDGKQADMVDAILDASESLARTSRKVNEFDWLAEKDTECIEHELFPLVKQCVEQVRATSDDATVSIDVPDDISVSAIYDIDVAVRNLVENALEHGRDDDPMTVDITARASAETVTLTVADDGPGIPQSEIEVIEEGQETPLEHASGLGLWLVQHVVETSGGTLSFGVDDGTTVSVRLPRADTEE